jgi:hypothetical protein
MLLVLKLNTRRIKMSKHIDDVENGITNGMHIEEGERLMESWQANLGTGDEVYWNDPDAGACSGHAKFIGHMSYVDGVSVIVKDGIKMQVFTKELS